MDNEHKRWMKGAIILLCAIIAIAANAAAISYGCIKDAEGHRETFYIVVGALNLLINGYAAVRAFRPIINDEDDGAAEKEEE